MSKKDERIIRNVIGAIVAFILIVWFLSQFLDILKRNPEPLWFVLGIIATLTAEGLLYLGVVVFRRMRGY